MTHTLKKRLHIKQVGTDIDVKGKKMKTSDYLVSGPVTIFLIVFGLVAIAQWIMEEQEKTRNIEMESMKLIWDIDSNVIEYEIYVGKTPNPQEAEFRMSCARCEEAFPTCGDLGL